MLFKHFDIKIPSFKSFEFSHFLDFSFKLNVLTQVIKQSNSVFLSIYLCICCRNEQETNNYYYYYYFLFLLRYC
jgi:hypothetical protein